MLSVTDINHFYYLRDFTDMRCKHSRVLSSIREQLHREPNEGDVFIVMSRNRRNGVPYLCSALNYLDKFWRNLFAFLKDGNL